MPATLAHVCLNHPVREAAARCPQCGGFFCRECVTEHDGRVMCAACLRKTARRTEARRRSFAPVLRVGAAACGVLVAWLVFHTLGQLLLSMPASFHEGTLWKESVLDPE